MNNLARLASIGSDALASRKITCDDVVGALRRRGSLVLELGSMLAAKNGFYAFESALLVRALSNERHPLGLVEWNRNDLWKHEYAIKLDNALCFAEDLFGNQFCIIDGKVSAFDAETGRFEELADTLEQWAALLMVDYNYRTGYSLGQ